MTEQEQLEIALEQMRANIVPGLSMIVIAEAYDKLKRELMIERRAYLRLKAEQKSEGKLEYSGEDFIR